MIKNIIFDLGQVLNHVNASLTAQAFRELGIQNPEQLFTIEQQAELCDHLETGAITNEEFCQTLCTMAKPGTQIEQIMAAWTAMILDLPTKNLELLQELRQHYQLFLLSNTNDMHIQRATQNLQRDHGIDNFGALFDKVFFSYQVGLRKPNPEIFLHILEDQQLTAEHTVFVDDLLDNVTVANRLGLKGLHYQVGSNLRQDLSQHLKTHNC